MKKRGYFWNHKTKRYKLQIGEIEEEPEAGEKAKAVSESGQEEEMLQMLNSAIVILSWHPRERQ